MSATLQFVPTDQVRAVWPSIRAAVEEVHALDPHGGWIPEDVYFELVRGGTYLWTTEGNRGFFVTQVVENPYSRKLHVWIAHNADGDWAPEFFEQLKDIAAANNCGSITFVSDRTGWKRAIPGVRATTLYSFNLGERDG
jgi:hypothetical protein